jgi:hypothetical protein
MSGTEKSNEMVDLEELLQRLEGDLDFLHALELVDDFRIGAQ